MSMEDFKRIKDLEFKIEILLREVEALRSVISEMDIDKECYTQWHTAEAFARVREVIK